MNHVVPYGMRFVRKFDTCISLHYVHYHSIRVCTIQKYVFLQCMVKIQSFQECKIVRQEYKIVHLEYNSHYGILPWNSLLEYSHSIHDSQFGRYPFSHDEKITWRKYLLMSYVQTMVRPHWLCVNSCTGQT